MLILCHQPHFRLRLQDRSNCLSILSSPTLTTSPPALIQRIYMSHIGTLMPHTPTLTLNHSQPVQYTTFSCPFMHLADDYLSLPTRNTCT